MAKTNAESKENRAGAYSQASSKTSKASLALPWELGVQYLKGVGEKTAQLFEKSGIQSLWDLLLTLPRSFEDRRHFHSGEELRHLAVQNLPGMARGEIKSYSQRHAGPRGRRWLEALVSLDDSVQSPVVLTWFHDFGAHVERRFPPGTKVLLRGKVQFFRFQLQMVHPEMQALDSSGGAQLPWWEKNWVPIYRELGGLSSKVLRKIVAQALERAEFRVLPEALPVEMRERLGLASFQESLREVHFPSKWEPDKSHLKPEGKFFERIVFEELFMMALALHFRRASWREEDERAKRKSPCLGTGEPSPFLKEQIAKLPYPLTGDQKNVLDEVLVDIALKKEPMPMHRLVQGDVGSGKTVVAFLSVLAALESGFQAALMAPTEILADQHHNNFKNLFPQFAGQVLLLKGAQTEKNKREGRQAIAEGKVKFVIGTQALLTDTTVFHNLGLVVVDEQHRFGVEQRLTLKNQSPTLSPHLLVMTATPIPRSLALTLYGDLNISTIREKPVGRIPIETHLIKRRQRKALVERLKRFLDEKRQIYIVYPLVEESEELDLKDVQTAFAEWKADFGPQISVGLLHGRMKSQQKDAVMKDFKDGKTQVLCSTTVIEVGVDVPRASVIVIEHAERFGLSQLHQLRGRVGRGTLKSYCILVGPDGMGPLTEDRLRSLEKTDDGFLIAEKDLDLRGPGEFLGRRQSGMPGFRVAHILRDAEWMEKAREEARRVLDNDPKLQKVENSGIRLVLEQWWRGRLELTLSG